MSLRDGPLGDIKVPLRWWALLALVIAAIASLAFLLSDRRESMRSEAYDKTRRTVDEVAAPVGGVLSAPVRWVEGGVDAVRGYFFAGSENRRLRHELAVAGKWRDEALALREENARYRALMGVKTDPPIPMVFARTVLDSRGPFSNTRLTDSGSDKGVVEGNPVLGEHGLVGRIVGVAPNASRILLLTDIESRTPVLVPRTNARAILTGDGGPNPRLAYLRTHDPLQQGDRVLTSGDGGVFPRGLPVGVVYKGVDGSWRVALDSDASPIDYVQIMLFKDFSQLADNRALLPRELPGAMTELQQKTILGATPTAPGAKPPAVAGARPATAQATAQASPPSVTVTVAPPAAAKPPPKPKPKPKPPRIAAPPPPDPASAPPY